MAVNRVEELLLRVTSALTRADIPYCVIGGNAVAVWVSRVDDGAVRATKDVDLLVRREDLERIRAAGAPVGLDLDEAGSISVLLDREDPRPSRGVHLIFAGERIKSFLPHEAPGLDDFIVADAGFRVLNLLPLLTMKLKAFRRVDQVHLEDLLRLGLVDAGLAAQLPDDLRSKLMEIANTMDWAGHTRPL